ncbi:ribosomal protein L1 [Periconia macrospinosa]|uniref:Ribosomal protein L1 n=1 Tax=Periconia macrospinosa TaxID=97972 RepID=A0A2V1D945_9PLEO|nr:ribosomal protein L1 [Periconia macrospinosa]
MAHPRHLVAPLSRIATPTIALTRPEIPRFVPVTLQSTRSAATRSTKPTPKKKKARNTFRQYDLKHAEQFTLVDAMHYIRAFEVGRDPTSVKYEMAVRLRTLKNGPVVRNRLRLPHPVKTDLKICVIAPPDSKGAQQARASGAVLVGEEDVFEKIREGKIEFDRCICHTSSIQKLNKSGVARVLGPKGLMPSVKMGTVVSDVGSMLRDMVGASEYRERQGVVRMAVGQLGFTPQQMQNNVKTFMDSIKRDTSLISERISKDIHEVVLSSTNGPGFTLNGEFRGENSIDPQLLSGPL